MTAAGQPPDAERLDRRARGRVEVLAWCGCALAALGVGIVIGAAFGPFYGLGAGLIVGGGLLAWFALVIVDVPTEPVHTGLRERG